MKLRLSMELIPNILSLIKHQIRHSERRSSPLSALLFNLAKEPFLQAVEKKTKTELKTVKNLMFLLNI